MQVAGDAQGISAFQLDIKCEGLSPALLKRALAQAAPRPAPPPFASTSPHASPFTQSGHVRYVTCDT
jgi:hypothetical protein